MLLPKPPEPVFILLLPKPLLLLDAPNGDWPKPPPEGAGAAPKPPELAGGPNGDDPAFEAELPKGVALLVDPPNAPNGLDV